jgi:2-polyprenyl-3-methyl-5-hydroxy-6-metoxy-1,4-benzoquinol methylase
MDIIKSIKKYKREIYNDIIVDGKVLIKGARESRSRFEAINSVIPKEASVLDLGCHLGYFTIQLAYKGRDRIIVGMEGNYQRARIAAEVAEANKLNNVIILNNLFTENMALRWGRSCEAFNSILLLNVLHHCKKDQIEGIIEGISMLAPQLIIETPNVDEDSACGTKEHREIIDAIKINNYVKQRIAETQTHTLKRKGKNGVLKRPMYLFQNDNWGKQVTRPHYAHSTPSKHNHKIEFLNGCFVHKNRVWDVGVNIGTMVALNMVYPEKKTLFALIEKTLNNHKGPLYDLNLWNMVYTPNGIKIIDFNNWLEKKSNKQEAIGKLEKQYDILKKEGAKPLQVQNFKNWVKHVIVGLLGRYKN